MTRTLLDVIEENGGEAAVIEGHHPLSRRLRASSDTALTHFTCRCGRTVAAEMMRDLDPPGVPKKQRLTQEEREALGFGTDRVRCDACCEGAVQRELISEGRMRELSGAPARRAAIRAPAGGAVQQ